MLGLAIVGSGAIANTHASAIAQLEDARLVAVCSRNRATAAEIARPSGARVFDSVEDLVREDGIDAVLIATPSGCHAEAAIPALRAGRHVLCEKPLEVTTARVRDMLVEAGRAGVLLGGFFPLRCGAGAQAIRRALDAGRFGRLTFLSARVKWWRDADYYRSSTWRGTWKLDGGGALMNQGIHAVDLLQWFGGPPAEAAAFSATVAHPGIEDLWRKSHRVIHAEGQWFIAHCSSDPEDYEYQPSNRTRSLFIAKLDWPDGEHPKLT